jgi:Spy/CpxP family protein refolding chaperone
MWWKARPLLLLLSLTVNGAFIVSYASHASFASARRQDSCDSCCPLLQKLGASDSQWQELEPQMAAFRKSCGELCGQINRNRQELIELIAASETKPESIRAKQEAVLAGQRQMQELVVEHLLASKRFLTPEQQKALFDLIRTHCGCGADCGKCSSTQEGSGNCCDS